MALKGLTEEEDILVITLITIAAEKELTHKNKVIQLYGTERVNGSGGYTGY